jgi:nicotinamidase-related amidase
VIFTYHSVQDKGIVESSEEYDLLPGIEALEGDGKAIKTHLNAFGNTDLAGMLREKDCDTVLIIGQSALHCVLPSYFDAYDQDIFPYTLRGGESRIGRGGREDGGDHL